MNWAEIALKALDEENVPDRVAKRHYRVFEQALKNALEDFVESELPRLESDWEDAARDSVDQRRLDEARGK